MKHILLVWEKRRRNENPGVIKKRFSEPNCSAHVRLFEVTDGTQCPRPHWQRVLRIGPATLRTLSHCETRCTQWAYVLFIALCRESVAFGLLLMRLGVLFSSAAKNVSAITMARRPVNHWALLLEWKTRHGIHYTRRSIINSYLHQLQRVVIFSRQHHKMHYGWFHCAHCIFVLRKLAKWCIDIDIKQ